MAQVRWGVCELMCEKENVSYAVCDVVVSFGQGECFGHGMTNVQVLDYAIAIKWRDKRYSLKSR